MIAFFIVSYLLNPTSSLPSATESVSSEVSKLIKNVFDLEEKIAEDLVSADPLVFAAKRQASYADQISVLRMQLQNADSLSSGEYVLLVRATSRALINANIDFKTEEARRNYIEAFTIIYNAFNDVRLSLVQKEYMITLLHDVLFNSCWKFNWFAVAAREFDNGAFIQSVSPSYTVKEGDQWHNNQFVGIDGILIPFAETLSNRDEVWNNERLFADAVFKKLVSSIGDDGYLFTPMVAALSTIVTLHELDNPNLSDIEKRVIHKKLKVQFSGLMTANETYQMKSDFIDFRARALSVIIATSVHETAPELFVAPSDIDAIFSDLISLAGEFSKRHGSYSAEYFIRSYYAALKAKQNASHDELSSILYFLNDTATLEKGIGYTLFMRSGHYLPEYPPIEDGVRPFLYQFALTDVAVRNTLSHFGWNFDTASAE